MSYINRMDIVETVRTELRAAADTFSIGKSERGNDILCAHCGGHGGRQIIITAGIHARECYTAFVALRQIRDYNSRGDDGAYIIPLVNPDGARFFESGDAQGSEILGAYADEYRKWKANANGVDLNCNFDANWGMGALNKRYVGASDYIGAYPFCAAESMALKLFTERVMPSATVSYHCMGGELYWEFFQRGAARRRDEAFAAAVARKIGVKKVDGHLDSAGGYKDWCVQRLGIPAVTVELIKSGSHPFCAADFAPDVEANADLPAFILDLLNERS